MPGRSASRWPRCGEKNNAIGRIANHIRTEKTLNFLFENARKIAGEPEPEPEPEANDEP